MMKGRSAQDTICLSSSTLLLPAGGVDIHRDGKGLCRLHERELFADGVHIPRLDGRNAAAVLRFQRLGCTLDDLRVGAVAGESKDARVCARADEDIIISKVIVLVAVVQAHRANGRGKRRDLKRAAKKRIGRVDRRIFADRIHVDAYFAPLFRIADKARALALGAGARHRIAADLAVAVAARLAVRADTGPCVFQHFLISHLNLNPLSE